MSEPEQTKEYLSAVVGSKPVKKPYVKPEALHERVFETMALSCGKMQVSQAGCHSNRKNS